MAPTIIAITPKVFSNFHCCKITYPAMITTKYRIMVRFAAIHMSVRGPS